MMSWQLQPPTAKSLTGDWCRNWMVTVECTIAHHHHQSHHCSSRGIELLLTLTPNVHPTLTRVSNHHPIFCLRRWLCFFDVNHSL